MKNNEENVLTENLVSISCEIRTCARLNSADVNIKSHPRCRTIRCQVASFEGINNGWFVYFHDQWIIIGSFYLVFEHFEIIIWLLLLAEFWPISRFVVKVASFSRFVRFGRYIKIHLVFFPFLQLQQYCDDSTFHLNLFLL